MNCEMNALSAVFPVHWAKKLYKITHLSGSVQITEIHQFPHLNELWWSYIIPLSFPYYFAMVLDIDQQP